MQRRPLPPHRRAAPLCAPLVLSILLAACASMPETRPPETGVEVPATWTASNTTATPDTGFPEDDWWRGFDDPELDRLVEQALERNGDLAAAAARIDQASAQARIAGADSLPRIDASGNGSRQRQNFIGFPIPGSDRQVLSTSSTSLGVSLEVSWEADLWGRLRAREAAALADVEASRADWTAARLSLAGQVAKGWFALREARAQSRLAEATVDNRRLTEERIQRRYEAGLSGPLDLRLAMTNRASAEGLLAQRRQQLDAARRQVEILTGRYPRGEVGTENRVTLASMSSRTARTPALEPVRELPDASGPAPTGLPSELLLRRPDLAAAERRLAAAGARIEEARKALYPRLSLTGSAGRRSQDLEDLLDSDFSVWSLLGNVLQPIFQGGRLRAAVGLSEARQRELAAGYLQSALRAFGEVETALAAESWLGEQVGALTEATEQSLAARELAEDRYAAGLADLLTVLESQRQALDAQSRLLTARRQRLDARVDLILALGGGFEGGEPPLASAVLATAGE